MKFAVSLVLLMFITFLSTPTIVGMIAKSCDTSYFYSMSEEELAHKEVKAEFRFDTDYSFVNLSGFTSGPIVSEKLSKHDKITAAIFIPPPEQA